MAIFKHGSSPHEVRIHQCVWPFSNVLFGDSQDILHCCNLIFVKVCARDHIPHQNYWLYGVRNICNTGNEEAVWCWIEVKNLLVIKVWLRQPISWAFLKACGKRWLAVLLEPLQKVCGMFLLLCVSMSRRSNLCGLFFRYGQYLYAFTHPQSLLHDPFFVFLTCEFCSELYCMISS